MADEKVAPLTELVVKIGDSTHDLMKAFPLTIGDWEDLETKEIVVNGSLSLSGSRTIDFVCFLLSKITSNVSRDDVRKLPMREMGRIGRIMSQSMGDDDEGGFGRPT